MPRPRRRAGAVAALLLLLPLSGCGSDDGRTLTVLAAASLTEVFEELADDFEADHPEARVRFSFGSSTELARQAADGAPGDVLATADETAMTVATSARVTEGDPVPLATTTLVLVVPSGNPAGIGSLADLDDATWVRCADTVPCGRIASGLLARNGSTAEPASLEEDVRATLEKVATGEAEAGFVYATDAAAADDAVDVVPVPGTADAVTTYQLAVLDQAADPDLAHAWVDLLVSPTGQERFVAAGFEAP